MTPQDIINGCFEACGGVALLGNVVRMHRDKEIKGVSLTSIMYFLSWGIWNLYYYPHLGQTASLIGGIFVVGVQAVWVGQIAYYGWLRRRG